MTIPEGRYVARAEDWDLGYADTGSEYIGITFCVDEGEFSGTHLTWRGFFTEKTQQRTLEALRYCGWDGHDFMQLEGLDRNLVQITVVDEEYDGKKFSRIAWVNRLGGLAVKNSMDDEQRRRFAERMKGAAMATDKSLAQGTPVSEHIAKNNSYAPDDDIPF